MRGISIASALALCLALTSCKDESGGETDTSTDTTGDTTGDTGGDTVADTGDAGDVEEDGTYTTTVGSEGGTVTGPDGVSLEIPAGALTADVTFTIQVTTFDSPDLISLSADYELLPHGTAFLVPVRITIPYDAVAAAGHEGEMAVWTHIDGTDYWYALEGSVDTVAHTVTGLSNHLSIDWAAYRSVACTSTCTPPVMPPPPPPAPGGQCDGDVIMTCQQAPSGCYYIMPLLDCAASGQTCSEVTEGADCIGTCVDECVADPGGIFRRCEYDFILECMAGPGDCNHWTATANCAIDGGFCDDDGGTSNAGCVAPCSDLCTPAASTQCNGDVIETCTAGTDGCLDWVPGTDCSATSLPVCDDADGSADCVEATTGTCAAAGGTCQSMGEMPSCTFGQEPTSPDPTMDCAAGAQFCCVTATGSGCSDAYGGCFPASDLGCSSYLLLDVTTPGATCPGSLICCAAAA